MKTKTCWNRFTFAFTLTLTAASAFAAETFVAHEWGTFTSVQGADGVQMEWNPLQTTDLPQFVYDRNRPNGERGRQPLAVIGSKSARASVQRMETPVIYFYSDREREVNVRVDFPQGLVTEWFPQVTGFGPAAAINPADQPAASRSFIEWKNVRLLPRADSVRAASALVPHDQGGSHYYAARETDADLLRVTTGAAAKIEHENFLFYRGVGYFEAPLRVSLAGSDDSINMLNSGAERLGNLFVLRIRRTEGRFISVEKLDPKENQLVRVNPDKGLIPLAELRRQLGAKIRSALTAQGLRDAEASAMITTWEDSWFAESGLRVLYVLPSTWTDRTLPLKLEPKPAELVRVMVGRAEVITPSMEWELLKQIVRYSEDEGDSKQAAVTNLRRLGLGRFTEPAARRVLGRMPSPDFSNAAFELIRLASALPSPTAGRSLSLAP